MLGLTLSILLASTFTLVASADASLPFYAGAFYHPKYGPVHGAWQYQDGLVIIDSDIIFGTTADFEQALINITWSSENENFRYTPRRGQGMPNAIPGIVKRDRGSFSLGRGPLLWPNATVTYKYANDSTQAIVGPEFEEAITYWKSRVPCLNFTKVANNPTFSKNVLTVISNTAGTCASSLGLQFSNAITSIDPSCNLTTRHEVGHVLGLEHENQRPDRDLHVTFRCSFVKGYPWGQTTPAGIQSCCTRGVSPAGVACGVVNNFVLLTDPTLLSNNGTADPSSAYDIRSLMHYPAWAFSFIDIRSIALFDTLVGAPRTNPTEATTGDVRRIRDLYCTSANTTNTTTTTTTTTTSTSTSTSTSTTTTSRVSIFPAIPAIPAIPSIPGIIFPSIPSIPSIPGIFPNPTGEPSQSPLPVDPPQ